MGRIEYFFAAVIRVRNLNEFAETYSGAGRKLSAQDARVLRMITVEADRTTCRLCGKCQSQCPQQIPITEILRFERYALDDHDWNKASSQYKGLPTKGNVCKNCGNCVESCPLNLPIPQKLAKTHIILG